MVNYKIYIAYDGTKYNGFQRQSTHPEKTIQGKLENVLTLLFKEDIKLIGSGRTDAGVHARGQVCNFHVKTMLPEEEILQYLAKYLPQDIAVIQIREASPRFHARYNAVKKQYAYTIDNQLFPDPFLLRYAYHVPEKLDLAKMRQAATYLLGTHDFKSFTTLKSKKKTTVRTLFDILIYEEAGIIKLIYEADGFLQHMVRILTGSLIEVGLGTRQPEEISAVLQARARSAAGSMAPPHGLCMEKVFY